MLIRNAEFVSSPVEDTDSKFGDEYSMISITSPSTYLPATAALAITASSLTLRIGKSIISVPDFLVNPPIHRLLPCFLLQVGMSQLTYKQR